MKIGTRHILKDGRKKLGVQNGDFTVRGMHVGELKRPELEEVAFDSVLQGEADLGEKVVNSLPKRFLRKNRGKYLAITYSGRRLALADTLGELNEYLAKEMPDENYYVCRIGYPSLGRIE